MDSLLTVFRLEYSEGYIAGELQPDTATAKKPDSESVFRIAVIVMSSVRRFVAPVRTQPFHRPYISSCGAIDMD